MKLAVRTFVAALATSLAVFACQLVAGIERVDKEAPPAPPDPPPPPPEDPCKHAFAVGPPADDDDRVTRVPAFWLAFRKVELRPSDPSIGLDLDGVCTCNTKPNTSYDGGSSCIPRQPDRDCDLDGGIDNKLADVLGVLEIQAGNGSVNAATQEPIDEGLRTLLVGIRLWNGQKNDLDVELGLVGSRGIYDGRGCDPDGGRRRSPPQWCGRDRWSYPSATTLDVQGERVPLTRTAAYVNDGTLVFKRPGPIVFFIGSVPVTIQGPTITGKLEIVDGGLRRLTGMLAGRIEEGDLLASMGQTDVDDEYPDGGDRRLCRDDNFPIIRSYICDSVDISRGESFDRVGEPCDALSVAISFVADEVVLGEERPDDAPFNECASSLVDAALYTCPPR